MTANSWLESLCLRFLLVWLVLVAGPVHGQPPPIMDPTITKTFMPAASGPGGTVNLELTITDNNDSQAYPDGFLYITAFSDDLDAALSGLTATSASTNTCGGMGLGFQTSSFMYAGGGVAVGQSCTIVLELSVPVGATPGTYTNTTSTVTGMFDDCDDGCDTDVVGMAASDDLVIPPPPGFAKSFAPNPVAIAQVSTLTFTIDNSGSTAGATALDFTDTLPAGLVVAAPGNASTTCTGGSLTAADGSSSVSYTSGTVGAGASCTVSVDVTAATAGNHVNTTEDLTSSLGNSGTATATLVVNIGVVPTLSGLGLILLALLLTGLGYWYSRRRIG